MCPNLKIVNLIDSSSLYKNNINKLKYYNKNKRLWSNGMTRPSQGRCAGPIPARRI